MASAEVQEVNFMPASGLDEARETVLKVKGLENYLVLDASMEVIDRQMEAAVDDLYEEMDARAMAGLHIDLLGWSKRKAKSYFSQTGRIPYRSKIELPSEQKEKASVYLQIGTYLRYRYLKAKDRTASDTGKEARKELEGARERFKTFYECSLADLFGSLSRQANDRANSLDHTEDLIDKEIMAITLGGNLRATEPYLLSRQIKPETRAVLARLLEKKAGDPEIDDQKLRSLWSVETFSLRMGVDTNLYYELKGWPEASVIEERLRAYLINPEIIAEIHQHLQQETGLETNADQPLDYWEIMAKRAERQQFPQGVETKGELQGKIRKAVRVLQKVMPLVFGQRTPLIDVQTPIEVVAPIRPRIIYYKNNEGKWHLTLIINPRTDERLFRQRLAHEGGHAFLFHLIDRAGGNPFRVPSTLNEEVAMLFQDQEAVVMGETDGQKTAENAGNQRWKYTDLYQALAYYNRAVDALTQMKARQLLDQRWQQGKVNVPDRRNLDGLVQELKGYVAGLQPKELGVTFSHQGIGSRLDLTHPDNGYNYHGHVIRGTKEAPGQSYDLKAAVMERFGQEWIKKPEARAVLLYYLAQSGQGEDKVAKFVSAIKVLQDDEILKIKEQLERWGLGIEDI